MEPDRDEHTLHSSHGGAQMMVQNLSDLGAIEADNIADLNVVETDAIVSPDSEIRFKLDTLVALSSVPLLSTNYSDKMLAELDATWPKMDRRFAFCARAHTQLKERTKKKPMPGSRAGAEGTLEELRNDELALWALASAARAGSNNDKICDEEKKIFRGLVNKIEIGLEHVREERDSLERLLTSIKKAHTEKANPEFKNLEELDELEKKLKEFETPEVRIHEEIKEFRDILLERMFVSEFHTKFKPINIIGIGSFGSVLEAQSRLIGTHYAVKRIPLQMSNIEKDLEEVKRLDSFKHEGIVRYHNSWIESPHSGWQLTYDKRLLESMGYDVHDKSGFVKYDDDCAFLYIQMELGISNLAEWLDSNDERDPIRIKSCFKQIVSAVDYIHNKNTIHRDLKPSNILVMSDDVVKICDLGIATACKRGEGLTVRTDIGTELYKAPEQGFMYDERVDIFSIGLILLEMSTALTTEERREVFNDIRNAKQINKLQDQHHTHTLHLVTMLTKLKRDERPKITEILQHPFFSE